MANLFFILFLFTWINKAEAQETKRPTDYIIEGKVTIEGNKPAAGGAISDQRIAKLDVYRASFGSHP